jgi:acetylornithine deacetylase/succinyl-diaminopimelate desuccinylase-like protein
MAHMDVVAAKASDWKYPPFKFREEGGYYLGRGSNDNKAALTGIVLALQYLRAEKFEPTRDIIVLFTGDEETIGNGARRAATEWRELIDAEYALNGDAGGGSVFPDGRVEGFGIQIAEKTYADFHLTAVNRGGHSSVPRPDNAIYALANALTAVERHRFPAMINDATRASFEMLAKGDSGQFGELLHALCRNDVVWRSRAKCLAPKGGSQCELPHFSQRQNRGCPAAIASAFRAGCHGIRH